MTVSRRERIEAMLRESPNDSFLRYGLALERIKEGDVAGGKADLEGLISDHPDMPAAYFQLAQNLVEENDFASARSWLERGIAAALRVGDAHAASEMSGFLQTIED